MEKLTERQRMVLDFVNQSLKERGYAPTLREIGTHMGIRSTNGVSDHLSALSRKGYLKRVYGQARALQTDQAPSTAASEALIELAEKLAEAEGWVKQYHERLVQAASLMCKKPCSRNCCSWKAHAVLMNGLPKEPSR